ncbi:MAG TPA: hypothetical protein VMS17_20185 [Gemmataceae bacterium]|nr:hypothetical protein [Gemmataceae bacterium]
MRHFQKLLWLSPLALLGAVVGVVAAFCGGEDSKPASAAPIKLPGAASRGVLRGDHYYTIIGSEIIDVDLKQRQATARASLSECYDYLPLAPFLDEMDGKACVASEKGVASVPAINVIDLTTGKVLHSVKYIGEVHGLGFAGDDRVFVIGATNVVVLDLKSGETVQTVPVLKPEQAEKRGTAAVSAYQRVGNLLYLAENAAMRFDVVDLEAGKVVAELRAGYDWFGGLQVIGDKAYVRSINLSYGINNPQFGFFDLKTKKYIDLKHPDAKITDHIIEKDFDQTTLVAGPDAGVCLAWKGNVYQFDADGKQIGVTPIDKDDGRLVGVWNGQALTLGADALHLTPLAKASAKGD